MPQLNALYVARLKKRLKKVGAEVPICPICQAREWAFSDRMLSMPSASPGDPTFSAPVIGMICKRCTYMIPFAVGALSSDEPDSA